MELLSAGLPFVSTRTRPARLKPMAARNPATPLPMTRKSAAGRVGMAERRLGILASPRSFALNPAASHTKRRITVHAAHGESLMADQPEDGMAPLPERLLIGRALPLPEPMEIDGHVGPVDHDSVDGEVEGDPVIDGEVALNLLLQLAEAVKRHEQAVKGARVLTRIRLPDPFHRGVDLPDTGRIVRVNVAGFGAGHRHQPDQTKDGPAGERLRAAYDPRDHAGIIHPSDMPYS